MALQPISAPRFPDVPRAPGVPPVIRDIGAVANTATALIGDVVSVVRMFQGPQWGIFDQFGSPAIVGDAVHSVDFRREFNISDFPMEKGAFASYNKVRRPFELRVTFLVDGSLSMLGSLFSGIISLATGSDPSTENRRNFLDKLDQAINSLDLFMVSTPEAQYPSVNITHFDYHREARNGGATMLRVDVWCQEVRIAAKPAYSKGGDINGTDPIDDKSAPANADPGTGNDKTSGGGPGVGADQIGSPVNPTSSPGKDVGTVQPVQAGGGDTFAGTGADGMQPTTTSPTGGTFSGSQEILTVYKNGVPTPGTIDKGYESMLGPGETAGPFVSDSDPRMKF